MTRGMDYSVAHKPAVLATMHRNERVIGPLLESAMDLKLRVPSDFDTDRFGSFTREIERAGSQLEAARKKIEAAFNTDRAALVGIASEGSFGPYPSVPFVPLGFEIVVLFDRETGLEVVSKHADLTPNFRHRQVTNVADALVFASQVGFPSQGVIVVGHDGDGPAPDRFLEKAATVPSGLADAVAMAISTTGIAHVETDVRAHRNPTRMRSIKRATIDLVRRYRRRCPECERPGFAVSEKLYGLPCSWCGEPTTAVRAEVVACDGCGLRLEQPVQATEAEPGRCNYCNP